MTARQARDPHVGSFYVSAYNFDALDRVSY